MTDTTRRTVIGAGGAGLIAMLSACAGYSTGGGATAAEPIPAEELAGLEDGGGETGSGGDRERDAGQGRGQEAADALAKTGDIPEGGGKVFADAGVVVTQPTAGQFRAFDITCTHQGCPVDEVAGGTINCPCHGSKFKISDGSVAAGPAGRPLARKNIKVVGDSIVLA